MKESFEGTKEKECNQDEGQSIRNRRVEEIRMAGPKEKELERWNQEELAVSTSNHKYERKP